MQIPRDILSDISNHAYSQITFYTFNKNTLQASKKYREGRLCGLRYVSELALYYMRLEKELVNEFRKQIDQQMQLHSCLPESEYKAGLYEGLNQILATYNKIQNTKG